LPGAIAAGSGAGLRSGFHLESAVVAYLQGAHAIETQSPQFLAVAPRNAGAERLSEALRDHAVETERTVRMMQLNCRQTTFAEIRSREPPQPRPQQPTLLLRLTDGATAEMPHPRTSPAIALRYTSKHVIGGYRRWVFRRESTPGAPVETRQLGLV
jgi:hypothetical protein